jgi:hypothetical protein
LKANP